MITIAEETLAGYCTPPGSASWAAVSPTHQKHKWHKGMIDYRTAEGERLYRAGRNGVCHCDIHQPRPLRRAEAEHMQNR
ncbi:MULTISPECIES: hypothetical protein [unclassified Thermoactinomyces]|jgi:hypothetical protein|uniref:hypothetical protein n=1 Tax=unclassified Thermoactinomyces TaxID=2634588 RepID=UPI0018DCC9D7|nr:MULTISPECIES: hypothetical protein [unclassified Thermoactinomyces]MBH8603769.1 hypothetical protein [Thermoactinomyces sp. CICC 10522]MBH8607596.1 hypothetical protein [Thermoactinomyces sp. CICC 10521]